ncbi:MAG TPA: AMP-binding protein, partial [Thermoanaerobaculia bacterium]
MNLLQLFDLSLVARAEQPALEWQGRTYTFGELEARSNRVAHELLARGFVRGDRLAVQLANSVELIELYLACVKIGVIFVPVNVLYREREVSHILQDAEPREFLTAPVAPGGQAEARPAFVADGGTAAAIIYTSGTTGASKGAVLSHDNFMANAVNLTACWQISERDRFLLALPLFH